MRRIFEIVVYDNGMDQAIGGAHRGPPSSKDRSLDGTVRGEVHKLSLFVGNSFHPNERRGR
jgi:hypothetical protein